MELAAKNAAMILSQDKERMKREEGRTIGAMKEIAEWLQLPELTRVEAYDISNISGFESVGSMVVYERGKPNAAITGNLRSRRFRDRMITPVWKKC